MCEISFWPLPYEETVEEQESGTCSMRSNPQPIGCYLVCLP